MELVASNQLSSVQNPCCLMFEQGYTTLSMWGIPLKWMVYDGKSNFSMDDLGVSAFLETSICGGIIHHGQISSLVVDDNP